MIKNGGKMSSLKEVILNSGDARSVLSNRDAIIENCKTAQELVDVVNEFLTDEQKVEFIGYKNVNIAIRKIIALNLKSMEAKVTVLDDEELFETLQQYDIVNMVKTIDDSFKVEVLKKDSCIAKLNKYTILDIIKSLDFEFAKQVILDKSFVDKAELTGYDLASIIKVMDQEEIKAMFEEKETLIDELGFENGNFTTLINAIEDNNTKIEYMDQIDFASFERNSIISSCSVDYLMENKEIFQENDICLHRFVKFLPEEKQIEFATKIEKFEIDIDEKRKILVMLPADTKEKLKDVKLGDVYKDALSIDMHILKETEIANTEFDYNNIEKYRGLDELFSAMPQNMSSQEKRQFEKICEICPEIKVKDLLHISESTGPEFISSEKWIRETLEGVDSNWSDLQKLAYIDNRIGRKISYTPDFGTEEFDQGDARSLWKIIDTGYGVCNGVAQVEKYMLEQVRN